MRRVLSKWFVNLAHRRTRRNRNAKRASTSLRRMALEALEPRQMLAVFTVNSTLDNTTAGDSLTTLREAIASATNADLIQFDSSLTATGPATIQLSASLGALNIGSDISIQGPGMNDLTIDAQGNSRVFTISSGAAATISGLTITGGTTPNDGAGIYAIGNLTLDSVIIEGNNAPRYGGGIYAAADLTLNSSVVRNNSSDWDGGGLFFTTTADVTIRESTIDDNEAYYGAGIFGGLVASNRLHIESSTISNNHGVGAYSAGGGLIIQGDAAGNANIVNSTFSNNTAKYGGGIRGDWGGPHFDITNCTIAYNRSDNIGGVELAFGSTATLHNTIVAENTNLDGTADSDIWEMLDSTSSYNLLGRGGSGGLADGTNGNIVLASNENAGLSPLGNFGGPTQTHVLLEGSPAIDAGNDDLAVDAEANPLTVDQRGHLRPFDSPNVTSTEYVSDIGAMEAGNPDDLYVTVSDDENDTIVDSSDLEDLSLREALAYAARTEGDDKIYFTPLVSHVTLDYETYGPLLIQSDVQIIGNGADLTTIDANGGFSIFAFAPFGDDEYANDVTIANMRLTGASLSAVENGSDYILNLSLDNLDISGNQGGAVNSQLDEANINVSISDSDISGNGYGVGVTNGNLTITSSRIADNGRNAVGVSHGSLTVSNSQIVGTSGPGIWIYDTALNVTSCTIANNEIGVWIEGSSATITSTTISGNMTEAGSQIHAAGVQNLDGIVTLVNDTVTDNWIDITNTSGLSTLTGGVWSGGELHLYNNIIAGNYAGADDGNAVPADIGRFTDQFYSATLAGSNNIIGYDPDPDNNIEDDIDGNRVGDDPVNPLDPGLVAIEEYGKPVRYTLKPYSIAINAGDDDSAGLYDLVFDQMGDGYQRTLGEHVDIGANEAHVVQQGSTVYVYGSDLDDTIDVQQNSVTLDRFGTFSFDGESLSQITVEQSEGTDSDTFADDLSFSVSDVRALAAEQAQQGTHPWDHPQWNYYGLLPFTKPSNNVTFPYVDTWTNSLANGVVQNVGPNPDIHSLYLSSWDVLPSTFLQDKSLRVDSIGIVQIVKITYRMANGGFGYEYTDAVTTLDKFHDWTIDAPLGQLVYPYPTPFAYGNMPNRTSISIAGMPPEGAVISISDDPGINQSYDARPNGFFEITYFKQEFETYVIGLTGKEGIKVGSSHWFGVHDNWLKSVTVYGGVKWNQKWEQGVDPSTIPVVTKTDATGQPSEAFKKLMWDRYYYHAVTPLP